MAIPVFLQQISLGGAQLLDSFTLISQEKDGYNNAALAYFRNVQAGDFLVKMSSAGQPNMQLRSLPTGWISLSTVSVGAYRYTAVMKIADGSENNTVGPALMSLSNGASGLIYTADYCVVLRPNIPLLTISDPLRGDGAVFFHGATSGSLGSITLPLSRFNVPSIYFAFLHKDQTVLNISSDISVTSGLSFSLSGNLGSTNTSAAFKIGIVNSGPVATTINHSNNNSGTYPAICRAVVNVTF